MKVLLYGINFHPELTGIGKYSGEMVNWLANQGHEVDVVTAPPYYPNWKIGPGYSSYRFKKEKMEGTQGLATVLRCPLWIPKRVTGISRLIHLWTFSFSSLFGLVWGVLRRPDLIVVIIPTLFQTPQALILSKLFGIPSWLHVQDFEVDAAMDMGIIGGKKKNVGFVKNLALRIESYLLGHFDTVSSISDAMCVRLLDKGVSQNKVVKFPNWVDLKSVYPLLPEQSMRNELGIDPDTVVVLYAGNMGEKQGLDLLLDAASNLKDRKNILFVLAGAGSAKTRLQSLAKGWQNILWLPLQPQEKLNSLLATANIHVLPQRADAADLVMPSKLTGMLASGRAVVGTADAETELGKVLDICGVRVRPGDAASLAESLVELADNKSRRDELAASGRFYAERTLDRDVILSNFIIEVDQLLVKRCPA